MSFIVNLYQPFFELDNWKALINSTNSWVLLLSLVMLECLLSVDNAVVLAAQTKQLSSIEQQKKALFYGLGGAYIFRFIAIGLGTYLIHLWEIKVLGALYLLYLAVNFFLKKEKTSEETNATKKRRSFISPFWSTVISIELMDIAFSVDSVLASLAISTNPVIILLGGIIGILCMRGIAQLVIRLMEKIPELETMAYVLIFIIGIKLFLSIPIINMDIPDLVFAVIVFGTLGITLLIHYLKQAKQLEKN